MPTENRRVAAYLPKEIDDHFKAFIVERNLKGDSQALIVILSEFFGVSQKVTQEVAHPSEFVTSTQLQELEVKLAKLFGQVGAFVKPSSELVGELLSKLSTLENRVLALENKESSSQPASQVGGVVPGQMELGFSEDQKPDTFELPRESPSEPSPSVVNPLIGVRLAERLDVDESTVRRQRAKGAESFAKWSRETGSDGIAWRYDQKSKLYFPIES